MTTFCIKIKHKIHPVVEAYRLGKYDNFCTTNGAERQEVVEAYRLGLYDN